jgi:uncharacterized protein involved in response to NO
MTLNTVFSVLVFIIVCITVFAECRLYRKDLVYIELVWSKKITRFFKVLDIIVWK